MTIYLGNECRRRLAKISGVRPIRAVLLVMKAPSPELLTSGRQFAAWTGFDAKGSFDCRQSQAWGYNESR